MSEPNFIIDSIQLNQECRENRPSIHHDDCKATVSFHERGQEKEYHNAYARKGDMFIKVEDKSSPSLNNPGIISYIKYAVEFDQKVGDFERYSSNNFSIMKYHPYWGDQIDRMLKLCGAVRDFINFGSLDSADPLKVKQRKELEKKITADTVASLDAAKHVLDSFKKLSSEEAQNRMSWVADKIKETVPQKRISEKIAWDAKVVEDERRECKPDGFGVASLGLTGGGGLTNSYFGPKKEDKGPDHSGVYGEVGAFARLLPLPFSHLCYKEREFFSGSTLALMGGATFFHQELGPDSIQGVRPFVRGQIGIFHLGAGPLYGQRSKTDQSIQGYNIHGGFSLPLLIGGSEDLGLIPDLFNFGADIYADPTTGEKGQHLYWSTFNLGALVLLGIYGLSQFEM